MTHLARDTLGHAWRDPHPGSPPLNELDSCHLCGVGYMTPESGQICNIANSRIKLDVSGWWAELSDKDRQHALEKADEYGSADLEIMGKAMEALVRDKQDLDPESLRRLGVEMAIAFYGLGKAARLFGAYARGVTPSDDTWHDFVVYAMMARRVRETGVWPG